MKASLTLLVCLSVLGGCNDSGGGETITTTSSSEPNHERTEDRIDQLTVAPERPRAGYDRNLFEHWIDADTDGCDTRREVLITESLEPLTIGPQCSLTGGRWRSRFDATTTTQASDLDIDHLVPLAEAWDSGADNWTATRRRRFANDLDYDGTLIAVTASANRSKADQDPATWKPPERTYWCTYANTWTTVKLRWNLTADPIEIDAIRGITDTCPDEDP
ncbi:MAG: HNH endonuclease family protein [Acidimicrobiia bacterium]